jgi:hypothetical protein
MHCIEHPPHFIFVGSRGRELKIHVIPFLWKMHDAQERSAAVTEKNSIGTRDDISNLFLRFINILNGWLCHGGQRHLPSTFWIPSRREQDFNFSLQATLKQRSNGPRAPHHNIWYYHMVVSALCPDFFRPGDFLAEHLSRWSPKRAPRHESCAIRSSSDSRTTTQSSSPHRVFHLKSKVLLHHLRGFLRLTPRPIPRIKPPSRHCSPHQGYDTGD